MTLPFVYNNSKIGNQGNSMWVNLTFPCFVVRICHFQDALQIGSAILNKSGASLEVGGWLQILTTRNSR